MSVELKKDNQKEPGSIKATVTDEELAQWVSLGEAWALEQLYKRYSRPAISLAYRILGNVELAEEVAQEAFLRFWEQPQRYQPEQGRFVSWLLAVVHHRAVNERQRKSFQLNVSANAPSSGTGQDNEGEPAFWQHLSDQTPEPHDLVWLQHQRLAVRQALAQLSEVQRQVIELAYFQGLNQREIAQQLDEPLGTIKTRLRLGMQKLRGLLSLQELGPDSL